ncbi:MAG: hypothetical protein R6V56_08575, partial [Lentisphaeria bacterium]
KRQQWDTSKSFLVFLYLAHSIIVILAVGGTWTQKRYIIQAMPLLLGWTAIGAIAIYDFLKFKIRDTRWNPLFNSILALIVLIIIYDGNHDAFSDWRHLRETGSEERNAYLAAEFIKENAQPRSKEIDQLPELQSSWKIYHSGSRPIILTTNARIAFLAKADIVRPLRYKQYSLIDLIRLCQRKHITYVVVTQDLIRLCPELKTLNALNNRFNHLKTIDKQEPVFILRPHSGLK